MYNRRTPGATFPTALKLVAIGDLKIVARVGWKEPGHMAQTLGQRGRRQQRIFALAQISVVEVEGEREHVDGKSIREGRLKEAALCLLVDPPLFNHTSCGSRLIYT